jgi:MFS family permease
VILVHQVAALISQGYDAELVATLAGLLGLASLPGRYLFNVLYVVLYGAAYGAISPLGASIMADHFGRRAYGAITAVQGIAITLCSGLGVLVAGWLYDRLGNYHLTFWLCAGAFGVAAIGLFLTPPPETTAEKAVSP